MLRKVLDLQTFDRGLTYQVPNLFQNLSWSSRPLPDLFQPVPSSSQAESDMFETCFQVTYTSRVDLESRSLFPTTRKLIQTCSQPVSRSETRLENFWKRDLSSQPAPYWFKSFHTFLGRRNIESGFEISMCFPNQYQTVSYMIATCF